MAMAGEKEHLLPCCSHVPATPLDVHQDVINKHDISDKHLSIFKQRCVDPVHVPHKLYCFCSHLQKLYGGFGVTSA